MPNVDSFVVFFPRFTTLVGSPGNTDSFASIPLDVSKFGGLQLEAWIAEAETVGLAPEIKVFLEESLDGSTWEETMSTSYTFDLSETYKGKFLSFGFRLRWFRVRFQIKDIDLITCFAEGILRAGGGGGREWVLAKPESNTSRMDINVGSGAVAPGRAAAGLTGGGGFGG